MPRKTDIDKLKETKFDLIILGGGVTGAGILKEAVEKGYSCLLLDKGDFASGTSSRSAKLIHGGLRYLKYAKFGMVRGSLIDRNFLLEKYPHLVKPLPFIFPIYSKMLFYRFGMWLYGLLGHTEKLPDYDFFSRKKTILVFPPILRKHLKGCFVYYDAVTHDARLCTEVIHHALESGRAKALNYCKVERAEAKENHILVHCKDYIEEKEITFQAKYLVNAAGPWIDQVIPTLTGEKTNIAGPSKGIHLILPKKRYPLQKAVVFSSFADDGRMMYALPWENNTVVVGTTDTDFKQGPDEVAATTKDVEYILNSLRGFAPQLHISKADILSVYAGLRPLLKSEDDSKDRARDYRIWWSGDRIINIFGGKLTSFYSMGEALIDELREKFPAREAHSKTEIKINDPENPGLAPLFFERLKKRFGPNLNKVLDILAEDPQNHSVFIRDYDDTLAEVRFYARFRTCHHLEDLLFRRMSLGYCLPNRKDLPEIAEKTANLMQSELGWNDLRKSEEIKIFMDSMVQYRP